MSNSDWGTDERVGPRARRLALLAPIAVAIATISLLAWSAWPVIRPARKVVVAQAIFDRSASEPTPHASPNPLRTARQVQAPGWLEAEPFEIACTALADGVVERIHVLEGDYVKEGDVVAELVKDDSELRLRQATANLASAEATLELARAEFQASQRMWDEPIELERSLEAARAAADANAAEIAQLPSLIESANAVLSERTEVAERLRLSTQRGATSEIELIIAEQRVASQQADVDALRARQPILEAHARRLRADIRAAERNLALRIEDKRRLDASVAAVANAEASVARAQAMRDEAQLEFERMIIRAPMSGFVQRRHKVPGDKVIRMMDDSHSAHIVHLYDPARLQVRVDVPLADASQISVGQPCDVVVEVLPDRVFQGRVLRITHEADLQKNTLQVKVKVLNPEPILRPEMLTRVVFLPPAGVPQPAHESVSQIRSRVLAPASALEFDGSSARMWLVADRRNNRGTLRSCPVDVVERAEDWVTIEGDLRPGALLAIGVNNPKEGEHVLIGRSFQDGGAR